MYAFLLVSAAALAAVQPVNESARAIAGPPWDPVQHVVPASSEAKPDPDQQIKPFNLGLPAVADGAELQLRALKVKLKVPI